MPLVLVLLLLLLALLPLELALLVVLVDVKISGNGRDDEDGCGSPRCAWFFSWCGGYSRSGCTGRTCSSRPPQCSRLKAAREEEKDGDKLVLLWTKLVLLGEGGLVPIVMLVEAVSSVRLLIAVFIEWMDGSPNPMDSLLVVLL